jgi:uncharacterized protein YbjT (DUF2867 family)
VAPAASNTATNLAVQDVAGNDALSFSAQNATNASTSGRPAIASVVVDSTGTGIRIDYNKNLATALVPPAFIWKINGFKTN